MYPGTGSRVQSIVLQRYEGSTTTTALIPSNPKQRCHVKASKKCSIELAIVPRNIAFDEFNATRSLMSHTGNRISNDICKYVGYVDHKE